MHENDLQTFAVQAFQGDKLAYRKLLAGSADVCRAYYRKRGFGSEVEDIVQETLIAIHRSFETYDGNRPFMPWLYAVASYKAASYFRKLGNYQKHVTSSPVAVEEKSDDTNFADRLELSEGITRAMDTLPPKQRLALEYLKIREYSVKEAAEKMGISESAVKVNAHRAYKALKEKMEQDGYAH